MTRILCKTTAIEDPGSKGFQLEIGQKSCAVFLVRKNSEFFAYYNECPHTGINLEWQEDRFLDRDNELIQCATHGALFLISTGECIAGPCAGDSLKPLPLKIIGDGIYLDI